MRQTVAPVSTAIKVISGLVLLVTTGMLAASIYRPLFLALGAIIGGIALLSYLFAPTAYELARGQLVVYTRFRKRTFGPVIRCSPLKQKSPGGLRLWGNGGLFAVTGIFWNSAYGIFRAYLTSLNYQDQVLVETETKKILISPQYPEEFVRSCPGA